MTYQNLNQIKSAIARLPLRERVALREYLEELKDFEELGQVVDEFRAASPTADWEEIVSNVNTAIGESRDAQAKSRVRHERVRERSHRRTRTNRAGN